MLSFKVQLYSAYRRPSRMAFKKLQEKVYQANCDERKSGCGNVNVRNILLQGNRHFGTELYCLKV